MSLLGLGTVKIGRNTGVKYPSAFDLPNDDAVRSLLMQARDHGINLIDTAASYGESEVRLGQLLPGPRDDWVIVSKAGEHFDGTTSTFNFSPEGIRASVERSLSRLRIDELDGLLIHSDGNDIERIREDGVLDTLASLKSAGLVRAVGMSTKTLEGARLAMPASDMLMLTLHRDDTSQLPVIREALAAGVGVLVKKAFASGHAAHDSVGGAHDALRFVLDAADVSSIVVGTINPEHLAANVRTLEASTKADR